MIEMPEACVMAGQLNKTVCGREIVSLTMNDTPHKFAFYAGDPADYGGFLKSKRFETAVSYGGMVELRAGDYRLVFSDGVNLRFYDETSRRPVKHQMLIEFYDGTALSGSVQMYGGLWGFVDGDFENEYRKAALEKPSPISSAFDNAYFSCLIGADKVQKLSLKAFLATEQRIPGLGNGVLQDILWRCKLHPRQKVLTLSTEEKDALYSGIRQTLDMMISAGGRDTEKDLFGQNGGYPVRMSTLHASEGCPACGSSITKEAYMGGSIYYCPECQKLGGDL
jgi:formamidopyrimidine-DNA glycosylase